MRVVVVVAAMLFCMPVFAQGVKLKSVTNSIGMKLIEGPAGTFTMGGRTHPAVNVTLTKPFGLGKTEVTQGQWKSVMGTEPWDGEDGVRDDNDNPVTFVSWDDATEFCKKLTAIERKAGTLQADEEYRLPTEAEWEYACRAGTTTRFSFGDDGSKLSEYAWNCEPLLERYAHRVGLKKPNPAGLFDMHGNVDEWCSDWYGEPLLGGVDPVGPAVGSYRVYRDGSWRLGLGVQSSDRSGDIPSTRGNFLGFRVARSQSAQ